MALGWDASRSDLRIFFCGGEVLEAFVSMAGAAPL